MNRGNLRIPSICCFYILLFFILYPTSSYAQITDTTKVHALDSVTVWGKIPQSSRDVTVGTYVTTFSSGALESNRSRSLSELLSNHSSISIKTQGQGAMATASFRGTASSHTKVNWNGITLNPSMSNTFDFSQLPVFFADNVALYHGGGHLKNGTGALGGSVNVSNIGNWNDQTKVKAFVELGSYDTYTGAATLRFVQDKSLFQTRIYHQQSENDYEYINKVLKLEPFRERRKLADYNQTGVMQEAYFRMNDGSTISSNLWLMYGERSLPPPIMVNVTDQESNKDYGLNYYIGYDKAKGKHDFSAKAAYLLNIMRYKRLFNSQYFDPKSNFNRMQSIQLKADYTYLHSEQFNVGVSVRYSRDFVRTYSSDSTILNDGHTKVKGDWDKHRDIINLQGQVLWKPLSRLAMNVQVMGELNDDKFAPTFSAGISSDIVPNRLNVKASVSYNYKYPSMNDLYWVPGGNPLLKPEKGFSYDATLTYTSKIGSYFYIRTEASCYTMDIDDWIMWLPNNETYVWTPVNINNVRSQGVEALIRLDMVTDNLELGLVANYAYTSSENKRKNFDEDDTQYKQLPYIPLQKANVHFSAKWKDIQLAYSISYTDKRNVTQDESYKTPGYTIHSAELSYNLKIRNKYKLVPKITAYNLFDEYYESTQYFPMPLRVLSASLLFTF